MGDRLTRKEAPIERDQLDQLGKALASSLEEARIARGGAARVRARLLAREPVRAVVQPRLRIGRLAALGAAAAAILVFAASGALRTAPVTASHAVPASTAAPAPLTFVAGNASGIVGQPIASPAEAPSDTPVVFSDGSSLRLGPAARVRVAEVQKNGARVLVESGKVHVSVVHQDETRWAVNAGPFEVRVTGTRFDVSWDPAASGLVVRMEEGSVFVRGCGLNAAGEEGRRLVTGDVLQVSCPNEVAVATTVTPAPTAVASAARTPDAPAPAPAPSANAAATSVKDPAAAGGTSVVALARRGSHKEALMAAEAGGFESTCNGLSAEDLLVLADSARYAGRFERAALALTTARRRFAGSDAAASAAFELGRIAMDVHRDLGPAADHFETYLREKPDGGLAREALGRAIEARHRAGDNARAERLAVRYLTAYPDGPHARLARKLTLPPAAEAPQHER